MRLSKWADRLYVTISRNFETLLIMALFGDMILIGCIGVSIWFWTYR